MRCVLTILFASMLLTGCVRRRQELYSPPSAKFSQFSQYTADDFDWPSVQRVLIMPFGNRSDDPQIPEQIRTALAAELQKAGRFEIVVAPLDVEAASSKEVFSRGQFDEHEALQLSRRFQAQGILYGLVTQYHAYSPPRLGVSLLMLSPAEAVVVASVDGLFDAREQATVEAAADYYNRTQSFPLSLLGAGRVTESPDVFRRFVSHEIAQSLATVPAPTAPPGSSGQDPARSEPRRSVSVWSDEERRDGTLPPMVPVDELPPPTSSPRADHVLDQRPHGLNPWGTAGNMRDGSATAVWHDNGSQIGRPSDTRVTHIFMNPRLTGGRNFDSNPGDDGIRVVIEPRNTDGQFLPRAGALSVVVLDPAEKQTAARVARWNLEQSQLAPLLRTSEVLGRGFHLRLLWPGEPPRHSDLQVFVRYVSEDGRKLEADQRIFVDLPRHEFVSPPPSYLFKPPRAADAPHTANPTQETPALPPLTAPFHRAASRRSFESNSLLDERIPDNSASARVATPPALGDRSSDLDDPPPKPPREFVLPALKPLRTSKASGRNEALPDRYENEVSQTPESLLRIPKLRADGDGRRDQMDGMIRVDPSVVRPDIACSAF